MGKTTKNIKTAGKAAKTTGRVTATATRYTAARWRGLLPLLCIGAAVAFALIAHLMTWVIASWEAWALIVGTGITLFVWADGWVGQMQATHRRPAGAFVIYTSAAAIALIVVPHILAVYVLMLITAMVLGTWWWNGDAYRSFKATERWQRKLENQLPKLGISQDTRITSVKQNAKGDVEWRLYLGDHDRPDQIKTDSLAHMLKTDVSRVIVRRVEKGSSRSIKIVWLATSPDKAVDPVHPAVHAANRGADAEWAPGSRSVLDGMISGWQLGAGVHSVARTFTTKGKDARHLGILGATGSGKTSTSSGMLLSGIACRDLVIGICDIPKDGNLGHPFRGAVHRVATTYDELEADLRGLLALAKDRIRRMNDGEVLAENGKKLRKWRPTRQDPSVLYMIDELGNTMRDRENEDPGQVAVLWDLLISVVQSVRQAGIVLVWQSQDAKSESIDTTFRKAMGSYIVHRVATTQCVNGIFTEHDCDMFETGLPNAGMNWTGDVDGGAPVKAFGFDMDTVIEAGKEFDAAVADYATARPVLPDTDAAILGWGNTLCVAESAPSEAKQVQSAEEVDAAALLREACDDIDIPEGAPIVRGAAELDAGDDERMRAIVTALADAHEPLSRRQIQSAAGLGDTVAKNLLIALQDDDKVAREGVGRATKYRLTRQLETA